MLPNDFTSTWAREKKSPMSQRITTTMRPVPLKDRITQTIYKLNMVRRKLEDSRLRTEQKHKTLFSKCVRAQETKDGQIAVMYANECSQVRKIGQTIISSQLALEQVVLRLETVRDFGDIAAEIMPATSVIRSVKGQLAGVIPEVSMQLGMISQTLDSLVLEVGEATGQSWNAMVSGEDSDKILSEAAMIAEQKVKEGFPELPSTSTAEKGVNQP
jgi:division protein CdvB (Snf7/Vps24/ESCRT-III family)